MSTWYTESFRGQLLWDLSRLKNVDFDTWKNMARKTDLEFTGGTLAATGNFDEVTYPSGRLTEHDFIRGENTLAGIFYDNPRANQRTLNGGAVTRHIADHVDTVHTGLQAVYKLYLIMDNNIRQLQNQASLDEIKFLDIFVEQAFIAQAGLMKTTIPVATQAHKRLNKAALRESTMYQRLAHLARSILNMRWKSAARKQSRGILQKDREGNTQIESFADDLDLPNGWDIYYDGWITYVRTPQDDEEEIYALTTVDLDRLQQMMISRSMLALHEAVWPCTSGNSSDEYALQKKRVIKIFNRAIDDASRNCLAAQSLCRDFRKIFDTYLSMAAGELSDIATDDMLASLRTKGYDKIIPARKLLDVLCSMPFDLAQDLGRIYKLLPAPDYDIGEAFTARQQQHLNMNESVPITGSNPCNLEEFRQYMRKLMIITLTSKNHGKGVGQCRLAIKPKWWKDYIERGKLPSRLSVVDDISLLGVSTYLERTEEDPDILKDSAACEEDLEEVIETDEHSFRKRNMLLRYLYDPACPTIAKARRRLNRSSHVHRVGFKMEAHKPVSRLFFIGNLTDRLVQSEMESNVHRVAIHCPGYIIGQTPEHTTKKIMSMVAPQLQYDETTFFMNFDISAWSPGMRDDIQRISHSIWAEVFDRQEFLLAHKINEKATIVLNKRGYTGCYVNPGANLEGYNGKEMTFMHCALMGYSVYRYRRETNHEVTIALSAYIDDGLASFKEKTSYGATRFLQFADIVEQTYQSLGFLLEKSKCFLSDTFAIFLNEIYLGGQHITYGLRAIMRIGTKVFDKHETLVARANAYLSGAQGALKAGLDIVSGLMAYLWLIGRLLLIYGAKKYMDAKACVLYAFTPKGLGGLGTGSAVALISNLVTDGAVEGIACIQEMCRAYPAYKPKVVRLMRQMVGVKNNVSIFLAPGALPDSRARMSENRVESAVARAIVSQNLSPRAKALVSMFKNSHVESLADSIIYPSLTVNDTVLADIFEATPLAILRSIVKKFQSSRTTMNLIGRREFTRIAIANRQDALASLAAFRLR